MKYIVFFNLIFFFIFNSNTLYSQDNSSEIELLKEKIKKIETDLANNKNDKAYFEKGRGLQIKSSDGKYSFQIKGRIMYDIATVLDYETTDTNGTQLTSDVHHGGLGSDFRRVRFSISGNIGDGWGFNITPDLSDGGDDSESRDLTFKDLFISKAFKGLGTVFIGNHKAAGGLHESTSSNNLMFQRPHHNEMMNFGHRTGIHYDSSGAFSDRFHFRTSLFHGSEMAFDQRISEDGHETFGFSVTSKYEFYKDELKNASAFIGVNYSFLDLSNFVGTYGGDSARANYIHMFNDRAVDDDSMSDTNTFKFFGPQLSVIYGQFFAQAEYQYGEYEYSTRVDGQTEEDFNGHGGSLGIAYALSGKFKHDMSRGGLSSFICEKHCFIPKYQYEAIDFLDYGSLTADRGGGAGQLHTFGFNHYFNSNVRLMAHYVYGDYSSDDSQSLDESKIQTLHARLHLKF